MQIVTHENNMTNVAKNIRPLTLDKSGHPKRWYDLIGDIQSKSIHADLSSQLGARDETVLDLWKEYPENIGTLARQISKILMDNLSWPNPYFIPSDPVDLLFRSPLGDLEIEESAMAVEAIVGKRISDKIWQELIKLEFGDFLLQLNEQKNA